MYVDISGLLYKIEVRKMEKKNRKKYRSFDLDPLEERKLLILAAHRGYTSTRKFIRVLINEAIQKAESDGLFNQLDSGLSEQK